MPEPVALDRIRASTRPVVIDVWAPWCLPCRAIERPLEELKAEFAGRVDLVKVNADKEIDVGRALGVTGIPTLLTFRGGREVVRHTGSAPATVLRRLFEAGLAEDGSPSHADPRTAAGAAPADRLLRAIAAAALLIIGWASGGSLLLIVLGGAVLFSAVYDRCPVWRVVAPRVRSALRPRRE